MGGGFLVVVVWAAVWVWAGRGLLLAEGRVADRRALVCGVVGLSGAGIGDTPALVGCCGCCGRGGRLVGGCLCACLVRVGVACCRGSGAVRPGCLACASAACWWWGVGVGGLVVNCIVDASILL